jgi:hypothetical protein
VPDHEPDAVHDVEFVDDHVSVADDPNVTLGWLIANVTVGAGVAGVTGICAAGDPLPPPPQPAMVMIAAMLAVMFRMFIQTPE